MLLSRHVYRAVDVCVSYLSTWIRVQYPGRQASFTLHYAYASSCKTSQQWIQKQRMERRRPAGRLQRPETLLQLINAGRLYKTFWPFFFIVANIPVRCNGTYNLYPWLLVIILKIKKIKKLIKKKTVANLKKNVAMHGHIITSTQCWRRSSALLPCPLRSPFYSLAASLPAWP
jgi:hypothetical protein